MNKIKTIFFYILLISLFITNINSEKIRVSDSSFKIGTKLPSEDVANYIMLNLINIYNTFKVLITYQEKLTNILIKKIKKNKEFYNYISKENKDKRIFSIKVSYRHITNDFATLIYVRAFVYKLKSSDEQKIKEKKKLFIAIFYIEGEVDVGIADTKSEANAIKTVLEIEKPITEEEVHKVIKDSNLALDSVKKRKLEIYKCFKDKCYKCLPKALFKFKEELERLSRLKFRLEISLKRMQRTLYEDNKEELENHLMPLFTHIGIFIQEIGIAEIKKEIKNILKENPNIQSLLSLDIDNYFEDTHRRQRLPTYEESTPPPPYELNDPLQIESFENGAVGGEEINELRNHLSDSLNSIEKID